MELFVHRFVTVSNKKILGKNCSEIYFAGTNLCFPFLNQDENLMMESKFSVDIKDIKYEIDTVKNISKTIIIKSGEPLLQSLALKRLAKHIKDNNLLLGLETYGTKPAMIKYLLDNKLVDIITLKLYMPLLDSWFKKMNKCSLLEDYKEMIGNIRKTIEMLQRAKVKVNVKTIIIPSLLYKKSDIDCIARQAVRIKNCIFELVPFQAENCNKYFMNIKKPSNDFMDEITDYIMKKHPTLRVK